MTAAEVAQHLRLPVGSLDTREGIIKALRGRLENVRDSGNTYFGCRAEESLDLLALIEPNAFPVPGPSLALELRPGGIYVLECEEYLSQDAMARVRAQAESLGGRFGVRFIVLDRGLKIARETEAAIGARE